MMVALPILQRIHEALLRAEHAAKPKWPGCTAEEYSDWYHAMSARVDFDVYIHRPAIAERDAELAAIKGGAKA